MRRAPTASVLVVVVTVFGVAVPVVDVVDMVIVLHRLVGAVLPAVLVLGDGVFSVDVFGHDLSLRWGWAMWRSLPAVSGHVE